MYEDYITTLNSLNSNETGQVNWNVLQSYSEPERNEYIFTNIDKIRNGIDARMKESVQAVSVPEMLPACPESHKAMCGDWYFPDWLKEAKKASTKKNLRAQIFTGIRIRGKGCHEVIFGNALQVRLTSTEELFLRLMQGRSPEFIKSMLDYLRKNQELTNCPWYLMKNRLRNILDELSVPYANGSQFYSVGQYPLMRQLRLYYNETLQRDLTSSHEINVKNVPKITETTTRSLQLCCLLCSTYNISADRLLVQDFSDWAIHASGKELKGEERTLLSVYLCASEEAKRVALSKCGSDLYREFLYWKAV